MICYNDGDSEEWDENKTQANIDEKKSCDCNACKFLHYFCHQLKQQVCIEKATLLDNKKNSPMYEIFQPCYDDAISVIHDIEKKFFNSWDTKHVL